MEKLLFHAKNKYMNSDSAFYIGTTHKICEDYVLATPSLTVGMDEPKVRKIILADGCSSSKDTDIGARLIVKSLEQLLDDYIFDDTDLHNKFTEIIFSSVKTARLIANQLNLSPYCLDATILIALTNGARVDIAMFGDGVVVFGDKNGDILAKSIQYTSGAPYYANYLLDADRNLRYETEAQGAKYINDFYMTKDGSLTENQTTSNESLEIMSVGVDDYDFIGLMSDGALSFSELTITPTSKTRKPYGPDKVFRNLFNIKQSKGDFIRRSADFWLKQAHAKGISHYDDLSIAALWVGK